VFCTRQEIGWEDRLQNTCNVLTWTVSSTQLGLLYISGE